MPQIEVNAGLEETTERLKSLLSSSGLQVLDGGNDFLTFRKVRLEPSINLPLSIYGSGTVRLELVTNSHTRVTYRLNVSPITVFSFVVTGLSVVTFATFANYYLISKTGSATGFLFPFLLVNVACFSTIIVLIMSFVWTKKRAERVLRSFLMRSI